MSDRHGFDRIIGQELAKRTLRRAARDGNPAHAYLFLGMQGTGKTTTAVEFAKALNCRDPNDGDACGECDICRTIDHDSLPDVRVWLPAGKKDTKIEQMQDMRRLAGFAPVRGRWKVDIVEQGETLNDHSANCILKLLEEPPDYQIIILAYRNASSVLPTLRSRCRLVRFTQVGADELAARLAEDFSVAPDEAAFLAAYSQGCPGRAICLVGDETFRQGRELIIGAARMASPGSPWPALKLAEVLRTSFANQQQDQSDEADEDASEASAEEEAGEDGSPRTGAAEQGPAPKKQSARDATLDALDILVVWYRDLLAAKIARDSASIVNADKLDEIKAQAGRYRSSDALAAAIDAILTARRGILGNANPQIATEALMTRLTI